MGGQLSFNRKPSYPSKIQLPENQGMTTSIWFDEISRVFEVVFLKDYWFDYDDTVL